MSSMIDRAADLLFPETGPRTLNVKFSVDGDREVTAEDLARRIVEAEESIRNGTARLITDVDGHLNPSA